MEKGILCLGCSYTWGEGLYFYSGLQELPFKENHSFEISEMREVYDVYRKKYRWPRLLANKLDSWEYTSDIGNGGANIQHYIYCVHEKLISGQIKYSDFDYFVWQFTDVMRDVPGGYEYLETLNPEQIFEKVEEECKRQLIFADRVLKKWESHGVKVYTFSWWDDLVKHEYYKKHFSKRHVDIEIENKKYDSMSGFLKTGKEKVDRETESHVFLDDGTKRLKLCIKDDFYTKGFQKNDIHLNKLGHELVSNSIYKKINEKLI